MRRTPLRRPCAFRAFCRRAAALAAAAAVVAGLPAAAFAAAPAPAGPPPACDGACPLMAAARAPHAAGRAEASHEDAAGSCVDAPAPALDCCDAPSAPPAAPAGAPAPPPDRSTAPSGPAVAVLAPSSAAALRRPSAGPPLAAPAPDLYTLHAALLI